MDKFFSKEGHIAYTIRGEGSPHFLLIHNSGGSHEIMGYTAAHFSKKGKTLTPDLLGHGSSDAPKIEYTLDVFAKGLIALCEHEKLKDVIFIGLNYGANIGIEIAQLAPQLISRLILIEPPIFMEPWIHKVVEEQIKDLEHPRDGWAEETVDSVFLKAEPPERDIALKALKKTPAFVKASTFRQLLLWDPSSPCSIPTLLIQTSQPFCAEEKARTLFSQLQVGRVVGSGPWATLEVPSQVHAMIDRFLQL